mmetsp:Transcript_21849/g.83168  ORF Transcript_21849/g.83168 Transcript_21849/m.83168 type:complete len:242 (-) Transcript_21849:341-1066(-)
MAPAGWPGLRSRSRQATTAAGAKSECFIARGARTLSSRSQSPSRASRRSRSCCSSSLGPRRFSLSRWESARAGWCLPSTFPTGCWPRTTATRPCARWRTPFARAPRPSCRCSSPPFATWRWCSPPSSSSPTGSGRRTRRRESTRWVPRCWASSAPSPSSWAPSARPRLATCPCGSRRAQTSASRPPPAAATWRASSSASAGAPSRPSWSSPSASSASPCSTPRLSSSSSTTAASRRRTCRC